MADGLILRAHDKGGALAISPTNIVLVGKHGVFHDSLILRPGVDCPVGIVAEAPLAPLTVLPVLFLRGGCSVILHHGWIVIAVRLGGLWDGKLLSTVITHTLVAPLRPACLGSPGRKLQLSTRCNPRILQGRSMFDGKAFLSGEGFSRGGSLF